ncbi:MAG: hypothetical protein MJE77_39235, partial [Proteobacteria bacterium]|nr:hypothetical protein [Pseudomonadota bacterium]
FMTIVDPLNDKECLTLAHQEAKRLAALPWFRAFVCQFDHLREFILYVRSLEQRDDFGDPADGPRIPCQISQRLRYAPSDPNCFERTVLYLAAAEILDSTIERTSASMVLDQGWHTFPVEIRDNRPYVVLLDPVSPPHNTMLATAYRAHNVSPMAKRHLAPWFSAMARNACAEDGTEDYYDHSLELLRNALITGEPIDTYETVDHVLDRAADAAALWGGQGHAAFDQMAGSIRNFSIKLNKGIVARFVKEVTEVAEQLAPQAIKAALVAKFGPAAAVALEGVDVAMQSAQDAQTRKPSTQQSSSDERLVGTLVLGLEGDSRPAEKSTHDSTRERVRRMTFAFR